MESILALFIIITCFVLLLLSIINTIITIKRSSKVEIPILPPGPKPWPVIGNLLEFGDRPHVSLAELSRTYGPLMGLSLGRAQIVVVSNSAAAREVLLTYDKSFSDRPIPEAARACGHADLGMPWIPASGLWRDLRKITNSHLFSGTALDASTNIRDSKVQDLIKEVKRHVENGEPLDIGRAAFKTSLNLLSTTLFSVDLGASNNEMAREIKESVWSVMEEVGKTNMADYFAVLKRLDLQGIKRRTGIHMRRFIDLFDRIIDQRMRLRRESGGDDSCEVKLGNDVLDVLIDMMKVGNKEQNKDHDVQLDRDIVEHLLLDLLVAGTETTSSTLEWSMAELLKNPDTLSKAQEELDRVIGKGNQITESDITQLTYLRSIVKETLRLHPSLPLIPRQSESTVKLYGLTIPGGSRVLLNAWAIGRDPEVWDSPEKFSPERFLETEMSDFRGRRCEFIPFGGGRRICPGMSMAMRTLHLMLGCLVSSFDWRLEPGVSPESLSMDDKFGLSLQRAKPLRAIPLIRAI